MNDRIEVVIGIQARSNSTRFPKKIFEYIGKKRVLEHVIDRAKSAAVHVMKYPEDRNLKCHVAILHPYDDRELVDTFRSHDCMFISGPENDVLARYVEAQRITNADFIVRLTSDCPLMLDYVIGKAINMCIFKQRDYVSNVEETCRTFADGYDVECMSKAALDWLNLQAYSDIDREHVTSMIRRVRPRHLTQGVIMSKIDTSETHSLGFKMSLDTPDDFHRIQNYYERAEFKMKEAIRIFGEKHVYLL